MALSYNAGPTCAVTALLVILALAFVSDRRAGPLFAFIGLALAYETVLAAPGVLGWQFGHWNWTGKAASIGLGLAVIAILRLPRQAVGLVLPNGWRAWVATALGIGSAVLFIVCLTLIRGPNQRPDTETLAFEAIMPGLDEELWFRGIGMALLARGLGSPRFRLPAWSLPMDITSFWFLTVHLVTIDGAGHVAFVPSAILSVLPIGVILALTRVRSGSLLGPVVAHNAATCAGLLMAVMLPASH